MLDKTEVLQICFRDPSIAQLVERWTVVVLSSIGHWFESGSKDFQFFLLSIIKVFFIHI